MHSCKSHDCKVMVVFWVVVWECCVQGIKVTDAASKRKIRGLLAKELEQKMELDDGWEEMTPEEAADMEQG
jgi:hypothetical protein